MKEKRENSNNPINLGLLSLLLFIGFVGIGIGIMSSPKHISDDTYNYDDSGYNEDQIEESQVIENPSFFSMVLFVAKPLEPFIIFAVSLSIITVALTAFRRIYKETK